MQDTKTTPEQDSGTITGQESAAMQIPMTWPYASVPVGCALMCLRLLVEFYKLHKNGMPAPASPAAEIAE